MSAKRMHSDQGVPLEPSRSADLIRAGSVKSNRSASMAMEVEPATAPAASLAKARRHSWANTACIVLLSILAVTAFGLSIWGAVGSLSNSDDIDAINARLAEMEQGGVVVTEPRSSGPSAFSTVAPEVLILGEPIAPDGYALAGSLYRGSGYWATRPSLTLTEPRAYMGIADDNSMVYITGGRIVTYDEETNEQTISASSALIRFDVVLGLYGYSMPNMPEPRMMHASVFLDGKVYVIGGYSSSAKMRSGEPSAETLIFDVESQTWSEGPSNVKPRGAACAAVSNGKIVLIGGFTGGKLPEADATNSIEEYDPEAGEWREVKKLPIAMGWIGCTDVEDGILLAGGTPYFLSKGTSHGGVADVYLLHPADDYSLQERAPLPEPRAGLRLVHMLDIDGAVLAVGGTKLATVASAERSYLVGQSDVEAYLPEHDAWVAKTPLDTPRLGAGVVATPQGTFVMGGVGVCELPSYMCRELVTVEVLEASYTPSAFVHMRTDENVDASRVPAADVVLSQQHSGGMVNEAGQSFALVGSLYQGAGYWSRVDNMPMGPLSDFAIIPLSNSAGTQSGAYLVGGTAADGTVSNATWLFNSLLRVWLPRAAMPEPRFRAAAAEVERTIYVVGGFASEEDSAGNISLDMLVYDMETDEWSVAAGPESPRTDACMAAVGGKLYLAGGYAMNYSGVVGTVEEYDPDTGSWSTLATMKTPRGDCMAASLNGRFVVLGGYYDPTGAWTPNSFRSEVEAFSPDTKEWTSLAPLPFARGDMAVAEMANDRLMVMGGETTDPMAERTMVASNEVAQYIAHQDLWVPKAPMAEERFRHSAAFLDGAVFVFGGQSSTTHEGEMRPLGTVEAFEMPDVPDVFVWKKVGSDN